MLWKANEIVLELGIALRVVAELTERKTSQTERSGESVISFYLFIYSFFIFEKLQRKSCILLKLLTKMLITVNYLLKITSVKLQSWS